MLGQTRRKCLGGTYVLAVATMLAVIGSATVLPSGPALADPIPQAVIGMPFAGKWAYDINVDPPWVDSCSSGQTACSGLSSHPSVHQTYGGDWSTDVYADEGAAVKLKVPYATGALSFSWGSSSTTCGQSTKVHVFVDGTSVGWLYFAHLNNAVTSGTITNGMVLGTVHNWVVNGAECNPGTHVHVEFKNTTNYSCYVGHGNPGVELAEGAELGVLGSTNSDAKQECTSIPRPPITINRKDFNNDGYSDLAWYANGYGIDILSGATQFGVLGTRTGLGNPTWIGSGDFNHDGYGDLAWYSSSGGTIDVLSGHDNFQTVLWTRTGLGTPTSIVAGDFNGDGFADLAWYTSGYGIDILSGATNFGVLASRTGLGTPTSIVAGDFNGDGFADLAWYTSGYGIDILSGHDNFQTVLWTRTGLGTPTAIVASPL